MSTTRISSAATRPGLSIRLEKILRNDSLERFRESGADLVLLISWKNVDDTIYSFGGA